MLQLAYLCLLSYLFHVFLHAGRIGAGLGLLIVFHQVWLIVRYEGHLTGSRVGMALHNLLDIVLPTIVIVRGMYDEFCRSARHGTNTLALPVIHQPNAPEGSAAISLGTPWQLWVAIKSLWLGCPAEIYDVTIKPFAWWLEDAHVLVQVIVWCGALELIAFGLQQSKAISDCTAWTVNSYAVFACYFGVLAILHGGRG